jgi:hypothetical protein
MKHLMAYALIITTFAVAALFSGCDGILPNPPPYRVWKTPVLLAAAQAIFGPRISCNKSGITFIVWSQVNGSQNSIFSNYYIAGAGWTYPMNLTNSGNMISPQVAVDDSGNAIAVWMQGTAGNYSLYADRFVPGTGWGTAVLIEQNSGNVDYPQVAVNKSGDAIAVWAQDDGTQFNIWANRYVPGTGWGTAELIELNSGSAYSPQVVLDDLGNAIAVWYQNDGTRYNVWANHYIPGTGWGVAGLIEHDSGDASSPQVAFDSSGNAFAVWQQSDGTHNNICANRYVSGVGWGSVEIIEQNPGGATDAHIGFDGFGNAIAVWQQYDSTYTNIWANRYVPGTCWGMAVLIEQNAGYVNKVQVAVANSGNAIAVWLENDDLLWNVWANVYNPGRGWEGAQIIGEGVWGEMEDPHVAIDGSGNATAVWIQHGGLQFAVWARRFCAWNEADD